VPPAHSNGEPNQCPAGIGGVRCRVITNSALEHSFDFGIVGGSQADVWRRLCRRMSAFEQGLNGSERRKTTGMRMVDALRHNRRRRLRRHDGAKRSLCAPREAHQDRITSFFALNQIDLPTSILQRTGLRYLACLPQARHGSTRITPVPSKSLTLRVTTTSPCTAAVAAMSASASFRRSGTCKWAHRVAIASVIAMIR
jgi:hypothetical protein